VSLSKTQPTTAICFDLDVLRTLVFAVDLGGFARAARRVGRSQSAVSLQMRRLEEQAGQPLFAKAGRSFAITAAGEQMLGYARRLLALNDEAVAAVRGTQLTETVRLGLPTDFAETWLPAVLARFTDARPEVRLEVRVDRNFALLDALDRGQLDLGLVFGIERTHGVRLAELPMTWIARRDFAWARPASLPLVVFEAPCAFRAAALDALDRTGVRWHIAFSTQSLGGVWAAVEAGLGVTIRTPAGVPGQLHALGTRSRLPALPRIALWLHAPPFAAPPLVTELRAMLEESIASVLTARGRPTSSARPRAPRARRNAGRRDAFASRR